MPDGIDGNKVVALLEMNGLKQAIVRTAASLWNPEVDNQPLYVGEIRQLLDTQVDDGPKPLGAFTTGGQRDAVVTEKGFNATNLTVQNFGKRVLEAVATRLNPNVPGLEAFFNGKTVKSVSYSDRYLRRHIDLPLVLSLYKAVITNAKTEEDVSLTIKTTEITEVNDRYTFTYKDNFETNESRFNIFRDMRAMAFRDEACKMTINLEEVTSNRELSHARQFLINFTDGSILAILLDQGVGFVIPVTPFPVGKTDEMKANKLYKLLDPNVATEVAKVKVSMVQISGTWFQ